MNSYAFFEKDNKEEIPFFMVTFPNKTISIDLSKSLDEEDKELTQTFSKTLGALSQLVHVFYICKDEHDFLIYSINQLKNTLESSTHMARAIIDFLSDSRLIINFLEEWTKDNLSVDYCNKWENFEHGIYD